MNCPACGCDSSHITETRKGWGDGTETRRRRICNNCGERYTTYEISEEKKRVVKRMMKFRRYFIGFLKKHPLEEPLEVGKDDMF